MEGSHSRTPDSIFADFSNRRSGLLRALTTDVEEMYNCCDPERENLCLYGHTDGTWEVTLPADQVPSELPEPTLGINFARDGMVRNDWLALLAVHSDAWLMAVAFRYGSKLDTNGRSKLFKNMNELSTLYEVVSGKQGRLGRTAKSQMKVAQASDSPLPTGRLLTYKDIIPALKGRQAELYWPDDKMWYLVEIHSVSARQRQAKIRYTSGEFEDLDLDEIIEEGHMSLITS